MVFSVTHISHQKGNLLFSSCFLFIFTDNIFVRFEFYQFAFSLIHDYISLHESIKKFPLQLSDLQTLKLVTTIYGVNGHDNSMVALGAIFQPS